MCSGRKVEFIRRQSRGSAEVLRADTGVVKTLILNEGATRLENKSRDYIEGQLPL